jgi:sulfur carrier protein
MEPLISIELNGQKVELAAHTVADVVLANGWLGKRIAIERNGTIVPKSSYAHTEIRSGDTLEVVVAVGGG